jgi:hypothetical protein
MLSLLVNAIVITAIGVELVAIALGVASADQLLIVSAISGLSTALSFKLSKDALTKLKSEPVSFGTSTGKREGAPREYNFYEAMEAHLAWKRRLTNYLDGRSAEELHPHIICLDNRCSLGEWLYGSGKTRFGDSELFKQLTDEHALFHFHASKVIEAHQAGNKTLAYRILSDDFAKQSKRTVDCLTQLNRQVEGNQV